MPAKKGGLGRNLSALLGSAEESSHSLNLSSEHRTLSVGMLQPGRYQPRTDIDEKALEALSVSIKKQGVLQPLLVRELSPNRYEIIAGERRWRASQLAGLTDVPVIIHKMDDETAMAVALVENLQREDLSAMDQARAMHRLTTEFDLTHQNIAELLSVSRTAVTNYLRLLNLAADVKLMLDRGDLDMGHARCLLRLDEAQQSQVARLIVSKQLSVRETESLVARMTSAKPARKTAGEQFNLLYEQELAQLMQGLDTKIKLKSSASGRGTLVLHYDSQEKLQGLLKQLTHRADVH